MFRADFSILCVVLMSLASPVEAFVSVSMLDARRSARRMTLHALTLTVWIKGKLGIWISNLTTILHRVFEGIGAFHGDGETLCQDGINGHVGIAYLFGQKYQFEELV